MVSFQCEELNDFEWSAQQPDPGDSTERTPRPHVQLPQINARTERILCRLCLPFFLGAL